MSYGFQVEISGDYACFSRPELKVERVSYDIITPSAARGILEAIFWKPAMRYTIARIDVCAPIRYENIRRNEVNSKIPNSNPPAAAKKLQQGNLYLAASADRAQRAALVLRDVRYVVTGNFYINSERAAPGDTYAKFSSMLNRRLEKGQNYHTPYLGTREFPARVRLIADGETPPAPISETRSLGLMLYDIDYIKEVDKDGQEIVTAFSPMYFMAEMRNGVVDLRDVEVLR